MKRAFATIVTSLMAWSWSAEAANLVATAPARATIVQGASVDLSTSLILPTVTTTTVATATAATAGQAGQSVGGAVRARGRTGVRAATRAVSNTTLTIRGQSGDVMSMAVPESFQVVRNGGDETLQVKTSRDGEYGYADNGVTLGANSDIMSVQVGGSLDVDSSDELVPGPYEGLLVVVVQYN